jgi:hypothetical protein
MCAVAVLGLPQRNCGLKGPSPEVIAPMDRKLRLLPDSIHALDAGHSHTNGDLRTS